MPVPVTVGGAALDRLQVGTGTKKCTEPKPFFLGELLFLKWPENPRENSIDLMAMYTLEDSPDRKPERSRLACRGTTSPSPT